jgi:hypothetical protein
MDVEREIHALAAENLAIQYVLTQALRRISRLNPEAKTAILQAFDDAAGVADSFAVFAGSTASPEHTVKAIRIVEEMRAVVFGNKDKPKHAV